MAAKTAFDVAIKVLVGLDLFAATQQAEKWEAKRAAVNKVSF